MSDSLDFDVPFLLGMMRLHEAHTLNTPARLADWIEARLDEGLHWFDHADIYGKGAGETRFGEALRARPALAARVRVVTKADIVLPQLDDSGHGVKHYDTSPAYLKAAIDAALSRLNVARLDHFLLHRPDPLIEVEATAAALDDAIDSGKVGAVGVSNFLPEQWRRLQDAMRHPLVAHQLELSLAHAEPLFDGRYDAVLHDGQRPLAWSPLGGGTVFEDVLGDSLTRLAEEYQVSRAGLALAWLRRIPGGPVPVIGTLRESRIRELAADGSHAIDRATWFALLEESRGQRVA
ncbi:MULTISPECIES: aldo/keto reductase [Modicisalibacter]|uniref:aldo/keto reductase n=1 Tax=Modicisalibacter TaxID=574347 RepID=UPI00100B4E32|nr:MULTISPECIES: aldo/keto reductase [Halomonadaceae]MBZ9557719.1 aldo/keto reductase [Modicisalibacter sp. R2A 31.J]MBZ9573617.1 aldo/keto reductase [Modicisalibacter sp. MOD 31.J]